MRNYWKELYNFIRKKTMKYRCWKEGFYLLKTKDGSEQPVLVHGYYCKDVGNKFVFGFNAHDGGGLLHVDDIGSNTTVVPVYIVEGYEL